MGLVSSDAILRATLPLVAAGGQNSLAHLVIRLNFADGVVAVWLIQTCSAERERFRSDYLNNQMGMTPHTNNQTGASEQSDGRTGTSGTRVWPPPASMRRGRSRHSALEPDDLTAQGKKERRILQVHQQPCRRVRSAPATFPRVLRGTVQDTCTAPGQKQSPNAGL